MRSPVRRVGTVMSTFLAGCRNLVRSSGAAIIVEDTVAPYLVRCGSDHFLPNLDEWRAGDVVLFQRTAKSMGDAVARLQRLARLGADSDWTHVGIYDGFGRVWDAMPGSNVRTRSMQDVFADENWVRIRRVLDLPASKERVLRELTSLGTAIYDPWAFRARYLARLARIDKIAAWDALWLPLGAEDYEYVVCSTFVSMALRRFERVAAVDGSPLPLPADFLDPSLVDVPLRMTRVVFA